MAIFTSSQKIFAKPFVEQLLIHSLGQEKYVEIANKVRICAREQLRINELYKDIAPSKYSSFGNQRKDLDDAYPSLTVLKSQRLLIDNDSSFAAPHQTKNLLCISGFQWTKELKRYQDNGYGLYFCSSHQELEKFQKRNGEEKSKAIYVKPKIINENNQSSLVIVYYDRQGMKELDLSLEESTKIRQLHQRSILESFTNTTDKDKQKAIINEIKKTYLSEYLDSNSKKDQIYICGEGISSRFCEKKTAHGNIVIHLQENDANIHFPDNSEVFSLKNSGSLIAVKLAKEYWQSECGSKLYFTKEENKEEAKTQLYDIIWDKVKNLVLKEQMIYEANHILLLTGALFAGWEESKQTQKSISKIIFNWQCTGQKETKKFDTAILEKRRELYIKGLELLRKVNPHLEPITVKSFEAALEKYPTLPEDGAEEHEDGCLIS